MIEWINTILQGLLLGCLYALFASGLSLSFGIMRIVNIAHGDLIVLAGFSAAAITAPLLRSGIPLWATVVIFFAIVAFFAFANYLLQRYVLNRTLGRDLLAPLLVTFGFSIVLQNAMVEIFSANVRRIDLGEFATASWSPLPGISLGVLPLVTALTAVVLILGLQWFFRVTPLGRAFRSVSDDPETAQLMGMNPKNLYALAMGFTGATLAIAGIFFLMRAAVAPTDGPARLIYAFVAVIIGGLGSLWGTLVGGILLGIAQAIGAALNPGWGILAGHLIFLLVLIIRPNGLFPKTLDR
ncbi:ABC transporter permease protein [Hydrogenophilus thermoluteolus]|uniref:ABC transporter permease protein n=1 Tax=Hydrogenophilus thermoluteolus TaxID=297 RepID=A0A2Z6DV69_HYDTE|nr:branched-chain amino acid ABC transporter permease [Hydrogenophilus thermoluteolus]BBD76323.1 ABC transporter permease protein [Hydrogenophilus thermoluteolus]